MSPRPAATRQHWTTAPKPRRVLPSIQKVGPRAMNAGPVAPRVIAPGALATLPVPTAALPSRLSEPLGGRTTRGDRMSTIRTGSLKLMKADENAPKPVTGEQVFREVADLIADRLLSIPLEDPDRGVLLAWISGVPDRPVVAADSD